MDGSVFRLATIKRISDPHRQGKGRSFKYQAEECHTFAAENDGRIVHEIEWKGSSWCLTETDYQVLIDLAREKKIDAVLVWKLDRLGRNNHLAGSRCDTLDFKYNVQIWSVVEGKNLPKRERDRLLDHAAQESISKSQAVLPAMRDMAREGLWPGRVQFGYELDKSHTDEDGEILRGYIKPRYPHADVLREMFHRVDNNETVHGLGKWLNREHADLYPSGWTPSTISYMLHNRAYIGYVEFNRTTNSRFRPRGVNADKDFISVKGRHEALVDDALFERVQAKLAVHPHRESRSERVVNNGHRFLLQGLLKCATCGRNMKGHQNYQRKAAGEYDRSRPASPVYRCVVAGHKGVGGKKLHEHVLQHLERIVFSPDALDRAHATMKAHANITKLSRRTMLQKQVGDLEQALREARRHLVGGVFTQQEYMDTKAELQAELERVMTQLVDCPPTQDVQTSYKEAVESLKLLGNVAPVIRHALASNSIADADDVAEALHAAIYAVRAGDGQEPVIDWQPWVALTLPTSGQDAAQGIAAAS